VGSGARIRWVSRLRSGKFLSTLLGHGFGCARGLSFQQSGCLNIWFGMHTDGEFFYRGRQERKMFKRLLFPYVGLHLRVLLGARGWVAFA
jgi:hypothetical protein